VKDNISSQSGKLPPLTSHTGHRRLAGDNAVEALGQLGPTEAGERAQRLSTERNYTVFSVHHYSGVSSFNTLEGSETGEKRAVALTRQPRETHKTPRARTGSAVNNRSALNPRGGHV